MSEENLLCLENISLTYGTLRAVDHVDLSIKKGEIHALIGEHGAGKSSLAHIISGFVQSPGSIIWNGNTVSSFDNKKARALGINFVTQGTELFDHMPVAYNLFNNQKDVFRPFLFNKKKIMRMAADYLLESGCRINPAALVGELSLPEKVMIDILRHLYQKPKLLILDEAIEKLRADDLGLILNLLKDLRKTGSSVIFITHRIDDVYEFADRVTILRNGRIIVTETVGNIDKINLIKLAYTQIVKHKNLKGLDKEFYQLLKYNEAILEFLPLALMVVDRDCRIKLLNNYGEIFFGRKRTDLINESLEKILDPQNQDLLTEIKEILQSRTGRNIYQKKLINKGKTTSCNVVIYPIRDGNYYMGSIIIIDDITEQEKLVEKIHYSEKLASVGLLAAGVAHEINNPLEIINNYLDILKGSVKEENSKKFMNYIEEELDSIEQIISNLITFSENNRYQDEYMNLGTLLQQMITLIKPNAEKRSIKILYNLKSDACTVFANRTKIKQVILNIVKNAFDAMPEGGELTIILDTGEDNKIRMRFIDSGTGFDENNRGNMLLPFYTTKEEREENMGLGLSIVYGIIESYSGKIELGNREDSQGCIVTVSLPAEHSLTY